MFKIAFQILFLLVFTFSFVPKEGFCDDHATSASHQCSVSCTTCCSAVILYFSPKLSGVSFQHESILMKYSFLYSNPTIDGFRRPPVFIS